MEAILRLKKAGELSVTKQAGTESAFLKIRELRMAAEKSANLKTGQATTVLKTGAVSTTSQKGAVSAILQKGAMSAISQKGAGSAISIRGAESAAMKTGSGSVVQKTDFKSAIVVLKLCRKEDCLLNVAEVSHSV